MTDSSHSELPTWCCYYVTEVGNYFRSPTRAVGSADRRGRVQGEALVWSVGEMPRQDAAR